MKEHVLRKQKDFDAIYSRGKHSASRYVVILYRKNRLPVWRTAFVASKKVGNSVMRSRARRLMKEAFRLEGVKVPDGYDMIFVARAGIADAKCQDVRRSIRSAFRKIEAGK